MKCCGSPITFTGRNAEPAARERSREVVAQFTALLFAEAFKPLSKAMGFYGDIVVASATQAMTRSERGGLTDHLERALEAASAPTPREAAAP
jgi:hypothetical protein